MAEVEEQNADQGEKTTKEDLQYGPAPNRGCTDVWCLAVLLAAWGAYVFVTVLGFADGNPAKLYLPRDYAGQYCDAETNWNNGSDLTGFPKLSFTLNATSTTQGIVKQFMCSTAVKDVMIGGSNPILTDVMQQNDYLCSCCLIPCGRCSGSYEVGGDITDVTDIASVISSKMDELTGAVDPKNLFSPGGANGEVFQNMWTEATKYFNAVCLPACTTNFDTMAANTKDVRYWDFTLAKDDYLSPYYEALKISSQTPTAIQNTLTSSFRFKALPLSQCPYHSSKCIPMPGVAFQEITAGYCSFEMAAGVVDALGSTITTSLTGQGDDSVNSKSLVETVGTWIGDFEKSIDAFIIVCIVSFAIGFIYLTILRFTVGFCVWFSVFLAFLMLLVGGYLCVVRSVQCAGSGLFDTGHQMAVATASAAEVAAKNAVEGTVAADETCAVGDCHDYRGVQTLTKFGYRCEKWGKIGSKAELYTDVQYPANGLTQNQCRNPYLPTDEFKADTIWCWTTNPEVAWQECLPVGTIVPTCDNGYAVDSLELRTILLYAGYILWILSGVYIILVCCFANRIRLAVAINKVATIFVRQTPTIMLLPAVQSLITALWTLLWCLSATFLLSQVPDDYISKETYSSYAVAYGTETVPGQCTGKWPTGLVWKDEENCVQDVNGTWGCWKCAPPRFTFDWRFAVSFFVFLWNNALNVAIGQCVLAGAVGVWFFTANQEKGSKPAIRTALKNVFRYHLGSVAFGSFIIAVIQFIRYLMQYYEQQAKAQKNRIVVMILKVTQCIMWCLEKCVKFLNKNAYIQIALMGTNFCTSAKKAFFLILRNAIRFGTVAILGAVIEKMGIVFITTGTVGLGYLILSALHQDIQPIIPMIIYGFVGYIVAGLFTSVFAMAVDTTLQCFLACEEMDLAVAGPEGFVPGPLEGWLDTSKKAEDLEVEK